MSSGQSPQPPAGWESIRHGLRFASPEVERSYRQWFTRRAVAYSRIGLLISSAGWVLALVAIRLIEPSALAQAATWIVGGIAPVIMVALLATYLPSWEAAILPATALANAVAGLVGVIALAVVLEQPEVTAFAVMLLFFAMGVFRLHPLQAALAAATYVLPAVAVVIAHRGTSELTDTQSGIHITALSIIFVMGVAAHLLITRETRTLFVNESIIDQQQVTIEEERDRSEGLLHNILPTSIAEQLKGSPGVIAKHHAAVTVLFADVVGFTRISETMPAERVVALLDDLLTRFDDLTEVHGVEKIRTMGDGYMLVGGAPSERDDHADAVVACGRDMLAAASSFCEEHGLDWKLRVGIHSGPVVAGVIGRRKFAYDLWGDTVNVASRLESTGEPDRIHLSETTLSMMAQRPPHSPVDRTAMRNHAEMDAAFLI